MSDRGRAELAAANRESNKTVRRLWLVAAIQAIVARPVFLVGGAAVDLHTGSYRPTDVDIVGVVTTEEMADLLLAGFTDLAGRHLRWDYSDGSMELIEFPDTVLDGHFEQVRLGDDVVVNVISVESLVVDRIHQATDGSLVTYEEAVRLVAAVAHRVDWEAVAADLEGRPEAVYLRSMEWAYKILTASGREDLGTNHFAR
ncbi:MAG: hypothetical protein GXP36_11085 [Actinobacteria bacterium]|nr:hypothetical protein [Actinomycetota bacterium]